MAGNDHKARPTGRREFFSQLSAAAATSGLVLGKTSLAQDRRGTAALLPTIKLGPHRITRLVAGCNPILGYSYMGRNADRHMVEYFTEERTIEFLQRCERAGINAHQFSRPEKMAPIARSLREGGSKMKFILLHSGSADNAIGKAIELTRPIAIVHHGGATDRMFRDGKSGEVHDYVKKVHDAGVMAGVSAHNPDCIKRVADEGWEVDLFMNCFYYYTRTPEEKEKMPPVVTVPVGNPFYASDPLRMTQVMRQVKQPCLGFKILAAGRMGYNKSTVGTAFQFAFEHIKPTDGVIVGMYPRFFDEIAEDAQFTRQFAAVPAR